MAQYVIKLQLVLICQLIFRGSDICLLVYAVDDEQSFYNLDTWKREFLYYADVSNPDQFPFVLLGNKVDLKIQEVPLERVEAWCKSNDNMKCFMTSAKESINVDQAFIASVEKWLQSEQNLDRQMKATTNYGKQISLDNEKEDGSAQKGCC